MDKREASPSRCQACRYWFERCCHALALLEGNHKQPSKCLHFVSEMAPPPRVLTTESWTAPPR